MNKQHIKFVSGLLAIGILLACTQTPEQIAEKAKNSTVLVSRYVNGEIQGIGSGFFVERDQIMTNIHVVAGADKVTARLVSKETEFTISGVVAFDVKNDLVILKITEKSGKPLTLGDSNAIEPGTSIFAIGTPAGGEEGQITHGTFHSIRKSDEQLRLETILSPGNSGGPVLNLEKAEVIGVVVASPDKINMSYAIPSNILRELLKSRRSDDDVEPLPEWWNEEKNPAVFAYRYIHSASVTPTDDAQKVKDAIGYLNKVTEDKVIEDNLRLAVLVYENKGKLLLHGLRDHQAAIENFKKLTQLMPDYWMGYYHLGNAFRQSAMATPKDKISQYDSAIDNYDIFIDFIKDNGLNLEADPHFWRGRAKWGLGQSKFTLGQSKDDQKEALNLYEAAIRDLEAAIRDLDEAIELKKDYADAHFQLGLAKMGLGQSKFTLGQSKDDQKEALNLYEAAIKNLDEAIRDQGKAMELLQDSVDIVQGETFKKDYANTYYSRGYMQQMLADFYKSNGNKEEAQRLYEAAVEDCKKTIQLNPNLKTSVQQMQKIAEEALEQLKK